MNKRLIMAVATLLSVGVLQAQERYNNTQFSITAGTMTTPYAMFQNLNGDSITMSDSLTWSSAMSSALSAPQELPWALGLRIERELMAGDVLGYGWSLGGGMRHMTWNATIPANTSNMGGAGLTTTEDWHLTIPMMGLWVDAGLYSSLHLGYRLEVFGSVGGTWQRYWSVGGKAVSDTHTDEEAAADFNHDLRSTMLGAYGQLGIKVLFDYDIFMSLSARYSYGLNDSSFDGLFDFYNSTYTTKVTAPFTSDWMVLLGVGIMFEN